VTAVAPGVIATISIPAKTSTGQIRSKSAAAANKVPSDVRGAQRLAAIPTA
jgi:hypothetical protein